MPLVGTPEHRYNSVLRSRADVSFALSALKKLVPMRGGKPKIDHLGPPGQQWKRATVPFDLASSLNEHVAQRRLLEDVFSIDTGDGEAGR